MMVLNSAILFLLKTKTAANLRPYRDLTSFPASVTNDFYRKAEGKGKGNGFPKRLFLHKSLDHHHKAKQGDHDGQGIFLGKVLSHINGLIHGLRQAKIRSGGRFQPSPSAKWPIPSTKEMLSFARVASW